MEQQPHNPVPIELENQFLLRLPSEPASALRKAIQKGSADLKDRLTIQMQPDNPSNPCLRRGNVRFDGYSMSSKLVDLPTVIESHKTIDRKTLYKTADICQLLICRDGDDPSDDDVQSDEEKKKDPNKVDKKFVYPHGVCRPLKNCRRRRFRKTLKKKHCLDEPEIEKEVKRLFRTDNEAVDVKWQLLTEEELSATKGGPGGEGRSDTNLGEQDLFGALSDIEEDDGPDHDRSDSKIEPPSEGDSTMYGGDLDTSRNSSQSQLVTEFSKDMFKPQASTIPPMQQASSSSGMMQMTSGGMTSGGMTSGGMTSGGMTSGGGTTEDAVAVKLAKIDTEINELRKRKQEMERNIATCPNVGLQQRLREDLMKVENELRHAIETADSLSMFNAFH